MTYEQLLIKIDERKKDCIIEFDFRSKKKVRCKTRAIVHIEKGRMIASFRMGTNKSLKNFLFSLHLNNNEIR